MDVQDGEEGEGPRRPGGESGSLGRGGPGPAHGNLFTAEVSESGDKRSRTLDFARSGTHAPTLLDRKDDRDRRPCRGGGRVTGGGKVDVEGGHGVLAGREAPRVQVDPY